MDVFDDEYVKKLNERLRAVAITADDATRAMTEFNKTYDAFRLRYSAPVWGMFSVLDWMKARTRWKK